MVQSNVMRGGSKESAWMIEHRGSAGRSVEPNSHLKAVLVAVKIDTNATRAQSAKNVNFKHQVTALMSFFSCHFDNKNKQRVKSNPKLDQTEACLMAIPSRSPVFLDSRLGGCSSGCFDKQDRRISDERVSGNRMAAVPSRRD